jgi:hypothetical protein
MYGKIQIFAHAFCIADWGKIFLIFRKSNSKEIPKIPVELLGKFELVLSQSKRYQIRESIGIQNRRE